MLGYVQFLENPFMVTFPLWHSLGCLRGSCWSSVPLWLSVSLYNSRDVNVLLGNTYTFPEFVFASFVTLAPIFIYVWCNSCLHIVEIQEWSVSCVHCLFSPASNGIFRTYCHGGRDLFRRGTCQKKSENCCSGVVQRGLLLRDCFCCRNCPPLIVWLVV